MRLASISGPMGAVTQPVGVDYGALMLVGAARGVDLPMLADVLPRIEAAIINPAEGVEDEGEDA